MKKNLFLNRHCLRRMREAEAVRLYLTDFPVGVWAPTAISANPEEMSMVVRQGAARRLKFSINDDLRWVFVISDVMKANAPTAIDLHRQYCQIQRLESTWSEGNEVSAWFYVFHVLIAFLRAGRYFAAGYIWRRLRERIWNKLGAEERLSRFGIRHYYTGEETVETLISDISYYSDRWCAWRVRRIDDAFARIREAGTFEIKALPVAQRAFLEGVLTRFGWTLTGKTLNGCLEAVKPNTNMRIMFGAPDYDAVHYRLLLCELDANSHQIICDVKESEFETEFVNIPNNYPGRGDPVLAAAVEREAESLGLKGEWVKGGFYEILPNGRSCDYFRYRRVGTGIMYFTDQYTQADEDEDEFAVLRIIAKHRGLL